MKIGVLALQGAFIEHIQCLEKLGVNGIEIRQSTDLDGLDGLILPGGESTVQGKLLHDLKMFDKIKQLISEGLPVLGTCAGLILLGANVINADSKNQNPHLGTLPVTVQRNAYGRQLGSFVHTGDVGAIETFPMEFIRAPYIKDVSNDVEILSRVDSKIVGVRYKNQIGLAFHPEMTDDLRIHKAFINLIKAS